MNVSMRQTEEAIMCKIMETASGVECEEICPTDSTYVLDGGYLLRRAVGHKTGHYRTCVAYVEKHFHRN